MDSNEFGKVLGKLDELKTLFSFGQKMMPMVRALFDFLQEIVPLLESINVSIQESNSKLPAVGSQLNKVTAATELATTEILNLVDKIMSQLTDLREDVAAVRSATGPAPEERLASIEAKLGELEMYSTSIMMSLQVQDITSQQIAAVNHLVDSVQGRLNKLVSQFGNADFDQIKEGAVHFPNEAFNAEAEYTTSKEKQELANELLKARPPQVLSSQAEIDALINSEKRS